MVLCRRFLSVVIGAAAFAGACTAPGCVAYEDRAENRPTTAHGTADPGPLADAGTDLPPGPVPSPPAIRPPTSAIAEPEPSPADTDTAEPATDVATPDETDREAEVSTDAPPVEPPMAMEPDAPAQPVVEPEPPAPPAEEPKPAPPTEEPVADTDEDAGDDTPGDEPGDGPDETPDTPPAEPPLHAAWAEGSAYNALFRADDLVSLTGDIDAVGTFVPAEDAQPGLLLSVKDGDKVFAVHGAPLRYLRSIEVRFDFGERLTIEGSWATIDGERVLMAQSITRGETRVEIRAAETGRPAWVPLPATTEEDEPDTPAPPDEEEAPPA